MKLWGVSRLLHKGLLGHELGLALGRALRRLSRLAPDRSALRSFSRGKSGVIQGSGGRVPCRGSVSRWSQTSPQDAFVGSLSANGTTILSVIYANSTGHVRWGRLRLAVGVKGPPRRDACALAVPASRSSIGLSSRQAPTATTRSRAGDFTPDLPGGSTSQHRRQSLSGSPVTSRWSAGSASDTWRSSGPRCA